MKGTHRQNPKSDNVYLKLLVKLYRFLSRTYLSPPCPVLVQRFSTTDHPQAFVASIFSQNECEVEGGGKKEVKQQKTQE